MKLMLRMTMALGALIALPITALVAQDAPVPGPTPVELLLTGMLPVLVAFVTPVVYGGIQSVIKAIKTLPDLVQQTLVFVVAYALTWGFQLLGIPAPLGLEGITPDIVSAALSALGSMGIYDLVLKKPKA